MYDENQTVKIRWNNTNKEWYKFKGYIYTKRNDFFDVLAKDLSPKSSAKINVICDYCGKQYSTQISSINSGRKTLAKDCCSACTGLKTSEISLRRRAKNKFDAIKKICALNDYILLSSEADYVNCKSNISFVCNKHGVQVMMIDNLIHGHKCIECSYEKRANDKRLDINYIKNTISNINGATLLNPEDYELCTTHNLNIKCNCGNVFTTSFVNFTRHNVTMCFLCSSKTSSGERKIKKILDSQHITYVVEKRFNNCRDKKPLPFDFYLPDYNLIIEFDGQHHYFPVYNEEHYKSTIKHDKIKNEYCKTNHIALLRISYWEGDNMEELITNKLKNI